MLVNLIFDGFELMFFWWYLKKNWNKQKVNIVWYVDDFIIIGVMKEVLENEVCLMVEEFLVVWGFMFLLEKIKIMYIDDGFDFFGFNVCKYDGKFFIKLVKKNVLVFFGKVWEFVKSNKVFC